MTHLELYGYLRQPARLSAATLEPMRQLQEAYPYCASFAFLYLYNLAITDDVRYPMELRRLSILLPEREYLFRLVEGRRRTSLESSQGQPQEKKDFDLVEEFLSEMRAQGADLPAQLTYPNERSDSDYFSGESAAQEEFGTLAEVITPRSAPPGSSNVVAPHQEDDTNSLGASRVVDQTVPTVVPTDRREQQAVVDLLQGPPSDDEDLTEELFTETLARIYIKQGRYDKALRIIRSISLNYPKKNRYFADQIRFLELVIRNNQPDN